MCDGDWKISCDLIGPARILAQSQLDVCKVTRPTSIPRESGAQDKQVPWHCTATSQVYIHMHMCSLCPLLKKIMDLPLISASDINYYTVLVQPTHVIKSEHQTHPQKVHMCIKSFYDQVYAGTYQS